MTIFLFSSRLIQLAKLSAPAAAMSLHAYVKVHHSVTWFKTAM
jgi:hypothetical protein